MEISILIDHFMGKKKSSKSQERDTLWSPAIRHLGASEDTNIPK